MARERAPGLECRWGDGIELAKFGAAGVVLYWNGLPLECRQTGDQTPDFWLHATRKHRRSARLLAGRCTKSSGRAGA